MSTPAPLHRAHMRFRPFPRRSTLDDFTINRRALPGFDTLTDDEVAAVEDALHLLARDPGVPGLVLRRVEDKEKGDILLLGATPDLCVFVRNPLQEGAPFEVLDLVRPEFMINAFGYDPYAGRGRA